MDITKLDGYKPEMTADEKIALIESYEAPVPDYTGYVKKDIFDKTASDLAAKKKELAAKMTEDEQKEADRAAKEAARDAELETLRKENAVSRYKANYIGLGYEESLAEETATAFADGDMTKVFANQKKHQEALEKAAKAAILAGGEEPPAGKGTPPETDLEKLQKQYDEAVKNGKTVEAIALKNKIYALAKTKQQ
ncbi:MAG: hypothetical protein PVJ60_04450 [Phycisphaerales bacterium]|jgi:hypothetical protein